MDAHRLPVQRNPSHHAGVVNRQGFQKSLALMFAGNGACDQVLAAIVYQPKDAVWSASHLRRHLQDGLQRLLQAQA